MRKLELMLLLVFLTLNSCNGNDNLEKDPTNFTLISIGFSPIHVSGLNYNQERDYAFIKVAKRWGIIFSSAGCVVDNNLLKSVKDNNIVALENIKNKFGRNWEEKFNNEVDAELLKSKYK